MALALINGNVITMSQERPRAEAILIDGNKIMKIGDTSEILDAMEGNLTDNMEEDSKIEAIDLDGRTVIPGFNDSHTHLMNLGLNFLCTDLSKAQTLNEALDAVKSHLKTCRIGEWILAVDFDETQWPRGDEQRLPKLAELDAISTEHPIIMRRVCGHVAVANSLALELIDKYIDTELRDSWKRNQINFETGELLGNIALSANRLVKLSKQEMEGGLRKVIKLAQRLGITSIRDIISLETLEIYQDFLLKNELKIRISCYLKIDEFEEYLNNQIKYKTFLKFDPDFLKLKGVKIFLDGSLGAHTAALSMPYHDDPGKYGKLNYTNDELTKIMKLIFDNDFQAMVHAIGDTATDQMLNIYSSIRQKIPKQTASTVRNTIEHLEVITPEQMVRLRELGIIASVQPNFAGKWSNPGGMNEVRLGEKRLRMCNPFNSIYSNNVIMAFGSDCMPFNPLYGIHCAVNHPIPEQRMPVFQALKAYTSGSAHATNDEMKKGTIEAGKFADLVVLSDNILAPENADRIQDIRVEMTILGGEIVHSSSLGVE